MLNLMTNPRPVSLDEMIQELLERDICLFGEEGHWYPNILEKEKEVIKRLAKKSDKNLIIALEGNINTPKHLEIYGKYMEDALNFFQSYGKVEGIMPKDYGFRGLEMGKKIMDLIKKYPDSIIVPVVGANHIAPSGSEIPAYLMKEILDNSLKKEFVRVFFRTATTLDTTLLKGFDLKGIVYFF